MVLEGGQYHFTPINVPSEITDLVVKSACKSCRLDPIPTGLVKDNTSILAPVIADIVNLSITTGVFPSAFKKSLVSPILKKTSLYQNELNNYRPYPS